MPLTTSPYARAFAVAALIGSLVFASPAFANTTSPSTSPNERMQSADPTSMESDEPQAIHKINSSGKQGSSAEDMSQRVETRIQNLHDKLGITQDQESAWGDVAQAMRDNEASMHDAIVARQNAKSMSAIDDLQSYQKIAQVHADGLSKLISSFSSLYDSMTPQQQKNADQVFGRWQGKGGMSKASAHKKGSAASSAPDAE